MKRVCHLTPLSNLGGVEIMLLDYLINSNNKNIQNHVIGININKQIEKKLLKHKIKYTNIIKEKVNVRFLHKIYRYLKINKINILQTYNVGPNYWGGICKLFMPHLTLIMSDHGNAWKRIFPQSYIEQFFYFFSKKIIVNSDATKFILQKKRLVRNSKLLLVPNGIDFNRFQLQNKKNSKKIIIGYVGRLDPEKDLFTLIDSFEKIKHMNTKLYIVGGGKLEKTLISYSKCKKRKDDIVFFGPQINIQKYYQSFDIFVSTPVREPYGNTLVEAAYNKLPIIASDIDGIPNNILHKKNGFLIKPTIEDKNYIKKYKLPKFQIVNSTFKSSKRLDSETVAKYIDTLIENKKLRINLGKNGYSIVQNRNSIKNYTKNLNKLYSEE